MTRGWFANNHEGGHCDPFCPFVRDCASCAFRGGDSSVPQSDSAREDGAGSQQNAATSARMGTAPGGASTPLIQGPRPSDEEGLPPMVATSKTPRTTNRATGSVR